MTAPDGGAGAPPAGGTFAGGRHRLPVRVYYEDTDFSGAMYHAGYLRFMERGRTELLRFAGVAQGLLHREGGGGFVVRRMSIEFLAPAAMDDVVEVETAVAEVGGASLLLEQRVLRGEAVLASARVAIAFVAGGRARRMPQDVRVALLTLP